MRVKVLLVLLVWAAGVKADVPEFSLSIKAGQFVPAELQLPAGVKIKLLVHNDDNTPAEFESRELNREKIVPAHSTVSVYIGPLSVGDYPFFDDFHPETSKGHVVVK